MTTTLAAARVDPKTASLPPARSSDVQVETYHKVDLLHGMSSQQAKREKALTHVQQTLAKEFNLDLDSVQKATSVINKAGVDGEEVAIFRVDTSVFFIANPAQREPREYIEVPMTSDKGVISIGTYKFKGVASPIKILTLTSVDGSSDRVCYRGKGEYVILSHLTTQDPNTGNKVYARIEPASKENNQIASLRPLEKNDPSSLSWVVIFNYSHSKHRHHYIGDAAGSAVGVVAKLDPVDRFVLKDYYGDNEVAQASADALKRLSQSSVEPVLAIRNFNYVEVYYREQTKSRDNPLGLSLQRQLVEWRTKGSKALAHDMPLCKSLCSLMQIAPESSFTLDVDERTGSALQHSNEDGTFVRARVSLDNGWTMVRTLYIAGLGLSTEIVQGKRK